jgi:hypothetical protein
MLAAGIADERGIVAKGHHRPHEHGEGLGDAPAELTRHQVVGPERQVRPVLLRGRAHRHDHDGARGDASRGLRPSEVLEEGASHRQAAWSQRSRNAHTHGPQIGAPFWKKRCPSSAVSPKAGNTRAAWTLPRRAHSAASSRVGAML